MIRVYDNEFLAQNASRTEGKWYSISYNSTILNQYISCWAYPNGSVGLNVKLEHMIRVYDNEFLAQNG